MLTPKQKIVHALANAWRWQLADHNGLNGLTDEEIARHTGLRRGRVNKLLPVMKAEGIVASSDPRSYPNAIRWCLTDRMAAEIELTGGSGN